MHSSNKLNKLVVLFRACLAVACTAQEPYKRTLKLMGSRFDIALVADNETNGNLYIDAAVAEIRRIKKLIASWDPSSQTSEVNRNAGIQAVKVAPEFFQLLERSIGISKLTDGAFDISYASMDCIWKFVGSMTTMPSEDKITAGFKFVLD